MVIKEAEQLLKNWNNGILDGAKANLAKELNISPSKISDCFSGRQNPSKKMIKKMAEIFGKDEEEIRRIFCTPKQNPFAQYNIKNKDCLIVGALEIELLKEQNKVFESKLELIIQLLKGAK